MTRETAVSIHLTSVKLFPQILVYVGLYPKDIPPVFDPLQKSFEMTLLKECCPHESI